MKQKKIEHITLNLIVFGTIAIIGVLARQTVLHYGWDEFSSYLIFVVCSIVMGAIYLNLQMVFRQLLSPTIEKCFMRFECYRNKAVVVETSIVHSELAESTINSDPVISKPDPEIEIETTSDTEEVSILSYLCSSLEMITFEKGSKLESISGVRDLGAFDGAINLTTVDMSECTQVKRIDEYTFYGNSNLRLFKIGTEIPPTCKDYTFYNINPYSVLKVPSGCTDAYKKATGWKKFASITGLDE